MNHRAAHSRVEVLLDNIISHFLGGSDGKEAACNARDLGLIPGSEDPLQMGMATHSSIPAWRIPRTEEPGRLHYLFCTKDYSKYLD